MPCCPLCAENLGKDNRKVTAACMSDDRRLILGIGPRITWKGAELTVADTDGSAGIHWKKSSRSAENGNCVEIAALPGNKIGVRDSKDNAAGCPVLTFTFAEWSSFVIGLKKGELDLS
jgi:Domain of unknown function (DUF397)